MKREAFLLNECRGNTWMGKLSEKQADKCCSANVDHVPTGDSGIFLSVRHVE